MGQDDRVRWKTRRDDTDPWDHWPGWDLREVEDNLELWLPEDQEDDEEGNTLRAHLPVALRETPDWQTRIETLFSRMPGNDFPTEQRFLRAMAKVDPVERAHNPSMAQHERVWEFFPTDSDDAIRLRERLLYQALLARAFPERFECPRVTTLVAEIEGAKALSSKPKTGPFPLETFAVRLLAKTSTTHPLAVFYGNDISERTPALRELLVSVKAVSKRRSTTLTIVLPTHLAGAITPE